MTIFISPPRKGPTSEILGSYFSPPPPPHSELRSRSICCVFRDPKYLRSRSLSSQPFPSFLFGLIWLCCRWRKMLGVLSRKTGSISVRWVAFVVFLLDLIHYIYFFFIFWWSISVVIVLQVLDRSLWTIKHALSFSTRNYSTATREVLCLLIFPFPSW